jgi:hypothetical protein
VSKKKKKKKKKKKEKKNKKKKKEGMATRRKKKKKKKRKGCSPCTQVEARSDILKRERESRSKSFFERENLRTFEYIE